MRSSNLNVERYIYEDMQKIDIDQDFKKNLKNKFMDMQTMEKHVATKTTRTSYLKVASFIVAAVLAGGSAFTAGNLYAKTSMNNMMAIKENAEKSNKIAALTPSDSFGKNNAELSRVINAKTTTIQPQNNQNDNKDANIAKNQTANSVVNPNSKLNTGSVTGQGSSAKANTGNAGNAATSSNTNSAVNQGTSTQNNTENNIVANADTPKPETTEIVLKMVSGRYMIQNIKVTASEIVKTLPEEYNNATVEESLKMPLYNDEKTAFEKEGSIYMIRQTTKKVVLVDSGTAPKVYAPINILSYIKQESAAIVAPSETPQEPAAIVSPTDIAADPNKASTSSVWVFDGNSAMKYNVLTNSDGKYTYINTFWSNSGKELYVLEQNAETKEYQILKVTLEIK